MKRITRLTTALGPVHVVYVDEVVNDDGKKINALGHCSFQTRRIQIKTGLHPQQEAHTLRHEWAHLVIWDAGISHFLNHKRTEAVCDAFATALLGVSLKSR